MAVAARESKLAFAIESSAQRRRRPVKLTARETEILSLVARGLDSRRVANLLVVSKRTVDYHLANAYEKLGARNRIQAIVAACGLGLLPFEPAFRQPKSIAEQLEQELISDCPELSVAAHATNGVLRR